MRWPYNHHKESWKMKFLFAGIMCLAVSAASAEWISVPSAPFFSGKVEDGSRAAPGTSWFACTFTNKAEIVSAKWTVAGLGVFDARRGCGACDGARGGSVKGISRRILCNTKDLMSFLQ